MENLAKERADKVAEQHPDEPHFYFEYLIQLNIEKNRERLDQLTEKEKDFISNQLREKLKGILPPGHLPELLQHWEAPDDFTAAAGLIASLTLFPPEIEPWKK